MKYEQKWLQLNEKNRIRLLVLPCKKFSPSSSMIFFTYSVMEECFAFGCI